MMDPLSIAVSACSIAAVCGNIISTVSQFVVDSIALPHALEEFNTSIISLRTVLNSIDHVVTKRPKQLPFAQKQERKHWQDVRNVLEACNSCLYKLKNELPDPPKDHKILQQARAQLELNLKSNVIIQIRGHITSYTQILQLSLTTMTLGSIWETQTTQDLVRSEIQKLTSEIRATNTTFQRRRIKDDSEPCDDLTLAEMLAKRNIEAWRESAESLAAAVSLYEPDQQSVAERAAGDETWDYLSDHPLSLSGQETSMIHTDSGIAVEDPSDTDSEFEPEPESTYCLSIDIIQCQIAANRENVKKLLHDGLYIQAEIFQRKRIELQDQLWKSHQVPFPDRVDAEEILADILRKQGTKDSLKRSKELLQELLQQEVKRDYAPDEDKSRCWRLYHKLGSLYLELGFYTKAKTFATRAQQGRQTVMPPRKDLVVESMQLLADACQLNGDIDEASGLRAWIRKQDADSIITTRNPESDPPNPDMADVLRWCQAKGFDVDSPTFRLDAPNATGKTPLHIAVAEEQLDIVTEIANHTRNLESRDADHATALLLACSTRNRKTTAALLKRGAKTNVQDRHLNTPLHRVQNATGGVAVARLLLSDGDGGGNGAGRRLLDVDACNVYDKTALHLACEMGNEGMLELLLAHGADINARGPAGCTPLLVAIDSRRPLIVRRLLEGGADGGVRDASGRDAVMAAKGTHLRSPEIIKLVVQWAEREGAGRGRRGSRVGSLELPGGGVGVGERRRKSSATSMGGELVRVGTGTGTETSMSSIEKGSPVKRERVWSQASGSTEGGDSMSSGISVGEKSLRGLKAGFRRLKVG